MNKEEENPYTEYPDEGGIEGGALERDDCPSMDEWEPEEEDVDSKCTLNLYAVIRQCADKGCPSCKNLIKTMDQDWLEKLKVDYEQLTPEQRLKRLFE